MNSKTSNIVRWVVFGALVLTTVVLAVWYYLGISGIIPKPGDGSPMNPGPSLAEIISKCAAGVLNWGYILIILGVVMAIISAIWAIVVAILRGVPMNKVISICVVFAALAILFIVSSVISKDWIETELNFFYLTFGFSILAIIFSVIYRLVKK